MDLANVEQLRDQARRFREAAEKMMEVVAILGGSNGTKDVADRQSDGLAARKPHKKTGTRLEQLRKFLAENGPASRRDIREKSGLPMGTIAYLLKAENGFVSDENKLWRNI